MQKKKKYGNYDKRQRENHAKATDGTARVDVRKSIETTNKKEEEWRPITRGAQIFRLHNSQTTQFKQK